MHTKLQSTLKICQRAMVYAKQKPRVQKRQGQSEAVVI